MKRLLWPLIALVILGGVLGLTMALDKSAPKADRAEAVRGDTEFALDLYGQLKSQDGNLFFSPNSISTALAMTYAGAKGNTATEMAKVMHFTLPNDRLNAAYTARLHDLNAANKGYELSVANALWGHKGFTWQKGFLELNKNYYSAGLNEVDFAQSEQARQTINAWVEKQTHDKIKDLIQPGVLDSLTRMVLTNAIYFKGKWALEFDPKMTFDSDFWTSASDKVRTPLMTEHGEFNYLETETLQAVELPYTGRGVSMIVLLPRQRDGLAALETKLTAKNLAEWTSIMKPNKELTVTLPKFKMTLQFELSNELQALGMKDAFSKNSDFTGMGGEPGYLYLSNVIHKAFVEVNEEGTEAAAATAGVIKARAITKPNPVFRADHPFVFVIRDNKSGTILFMGRLANPVK
ncbi:MAG TPA: serpin family protein [Gemmataceae bacterium]|nr:serpin family protein [Gemmataceae bacterium]